MIKSLFLSAALLSAAATAAPAQATAVTDTVAGLSTLRSAKTIRVTETCYIVNRDHELAPDLKMSVTFARPKKYSVSVVDLAPNAPSTAKSDVLITDGSKVTEYLAASDQYLTRTVSSEPRFQLSQILLLDFKGMITLLPSGFRELFKPTPGATSTVTRTQINGQSARLVTVIVPNPPNAEVVYSSTRLWLAANTGLPIRLESYSVEKGHERISNRIDYTNWTLNKPVAPSTFAWTSPPAATAYPTGHLLAVGTPAPDFSAITAGGKVVHLSDFRGKTVVLDFWATWCVPCQASMPHLESIYEQAQDQPVAVLALCVWDSKAAYKKWVDAKQGAYTFPTAFDTAGESPPNIAQSKYAVSSIPTTYVIDKYGNVAAALPEDGDPDKDHRLEAVLAHLGVPLATKAAEKK